VQVGFGLYGLGPDTFIARFVDQGVDCFLLYGQGAVSAKQRKKLALIRPRRVCNWGENVLLCLVYSAELPSHAICIVHHLEQFLIEQGLRDIEEGLEIPVGYDVQIEDIGLSQYDSGVVLCNRDAGFVDLFLQGCDFCFGCHDCWRLCVTVIPELCYRIGSVIERFRSGLPREMVVESQLYFW